MKKTKAIKHKVFCSLAQGSLSQLLGYMSQGVDVNAHSGCTKYKTILTSLLKYCRTKPEKKPAYIKMLKYMIILGADWNVADHSTTPCKLAPTILSAREIKNILGTSYYKYYCNDKHNSKKNHSKSKSKTLLWLGCGNMSLELSFAKKHKNIAKNMLVSSDIPSNNS
ncbi:MAG: hypothetical protein COC15_04925 [Legionellales bacterium]|nr:MAG: hypothetical protein COC15_04925 [Legionellales bacterium]